jgi:hypothetical protein
MSIHTSLRGALSLPINAAKGSESMEDPKPRPLRFFPTLMCNEMRSSTANSMQYALVCMLWNMQCFSKLTAVTMIHGLQPAVCAGSIEDMQVKQCTVQVQVQAGSAANSSHCLQNSQCKCCWSMQAVCPTSDMYIKPGCGKCHT